MKINIEDTKALILKFLMGELNSREEKELFMWVKKSPENKEQFLHDQQLLTKDLIGMPCCGTKKEWEKLSQRLKIDYNTSKKPYKIRRIAYITGIAAAFIIGIFIASVTPFSSKNVPRYEISQTFSTPNGARTTFNLPDGSTVWLNAGTQLTFSAFGKSERRVFLKGEAYFKIAHDAKRPFIISTDFGEVKDLGTAFNVKAYDDDLFTTTVEEGLVEVNAESTSREVYVKPGQQAVLLSALGSVDVKEVETQIFTCWKDGILIFKKDALEDIVKKLERWYNVNIELAPDVELKNYRFTGTIEMESLPEVLELIRITAPVRYKYDAKKRVVEIDMED